MIVISLNVNITPVYAEGQSPDALPKIEDPQALPDGRVYEDSDNDGYADVTEKQEGSDPFNAEDTPILGENNEPQDGIQIQGAVPAPTCRFGFRTIGNDLCISSSPISARHFFVAQLTCQNQKTRVATYGDLTYVYFSSTLDALYNPNGRWIGPELIQNDTALVGDRSITGDNDPDQNNFEGHSNKAVNREFWCAHDLE
jgi:hypothetical protein